MQDLYHQLYVASNCVDIYIYMCVCVFMFVSYVICMYNYTDIHTQREREKLQHPMVES